MKDAFCDFLSKKYKSARLVCLKQWLSHVSWCHWFGRASTVIFQPYFFYWMLTLDVDARCSPERMTRRLKCGAAPPSQGSVTDRHTSPGSSSCVMSRSATSHASWFHVITRDTDQSRGLVSVKPHTYLSICLRLALFLSSMSVIT